MSVKQTDRDGDDGVKLTRRCSVYQATKVSGDVGVKEDSTVHREAFDVVTQRTQDKNRSISQRRFIVPATAAAPLSRVPEVLAVQSVASAGYRPPSDAGRPRQTNV